MVKLIIGLAYIRVAHWWLSCYEVTCCAERRSTAQYGGDLVTLRNVIMLRNLVCQL